MEYLVDTVVGQRKSNDGEGVRQGSSLKFDPLYHKIPAPLRWLWGSPASLDPSSIASMTQTLISLVLLAKVWLGAFFVLPEH